MDDIFTQLTARKPASVTVIVEGSWHLPPDFERGPGPKKGLMAQKLPPGCVFLSACMPGSVALPPPKGATGGGGAAGIFTSAVVTHLLVPGRDVDAGVKAVGDATKAASAGKQIIYAVNSLPEGSMSKLVLIPTDAGEGSGLVHSLSPEEAAIVDAAKSEGDAALLEAERGRDTAAAVRVLTTLLQSVKVSSDAATAEGAIAAAIAAHLAPKAAMVIGRIAAAAPLKDSFAEKQKAKAAMECLVDGMTTMSRSREVSLNSAWAINHILAHAPAVHREAAVASGVVPALITALQKYGATSAPLAVSACESLANAISDSPTALSQCASAKGMDACIKSLNAWTASDGQATTAACRALTKMLQGSNATDLAAAVQAGVAKACVSASSASNPCGRIPQGCAASLRLLRVLAMRPGPGRDGVTTAGGLAASLASVRAHAGDMDVAEAGLWVACLLTAPVTERVLALSEAEVSDLLALAVSVLSADRSNPTVQALACRLVRNATFDPKYGVEEPVEPEEDSGIVGAIGEFFTRTKAKKEEAVTQAKEAAEKRRAAAVAAGVPALLQGTSAANQQRRKQSAFVANEAQNALDSVIPPPVIPKLKKPAEPTIASAVVETTPQVAPPEAAPAVLPVEQPPPGEAAPAASVETADAPVPTPGTPVETAEAPVEGEAGAEAHAVEGVPEEASIANEGALSAAATSAPVEQESQVGQTAYDAALDHDLAPDEHEEEYDDEEWEEEEEHK